MPPDASPDQAQPGGAPPIREAPSRWDASVRDAVPSDTGLIMLVQPRPELGRRLVADLEAQGYGVVCVRTVEEALERARVWSPDLVLVDGDQQEADLISQCRMLRGRFGGVLVVLGAPRDERTVIAALEAGADDFLITPIRHKVLTARVRAHLRRGQQAALECIGEILFAGRLRLDRVTRQASVGGMVVALRPKEFDLLACLIGEQGRLVSRAQLQARLWPGVEELPGKILNMHVWSLRRHLADHGQDPHAIVTVRGHGYRYDLPHRRQSPPT